MAEGLDSLARWCVTQFNGDVVAGWKKLCMLTRLSTQTDCIAPTQAQLTKNDVLRALLQLDIGKNLEDAKKVREGVFIRLCGGNHEATFLGMADFRRVLAPRLKTIQIEQPRLVPVRERRRRSCPVAPRDLSPEDEFSPQPRESPVSPSGTLRSHIIRSVDSFETEYV